MTIKVTIKNEDARPKAVVGVQHTDRDLRPVGPIKDLQPGESRDFWVHGNQRLVVLEINQDGPTPGFPYI